MNFFRVNCLFRNYEIKGNGDRVLIYLTLFISECLTKLNKTPNMNKAEAMKSLTTLALQNFSLPGDPGFPLSSMFSKPQDTGIFLFLFHFV